jgi:GntR family transcriptional repressor for pyruvate dehydrogenase complex
MMAGRESFMGSHAAFALEGSNGIKREGVAEKVVHRILDLVRSGNLKAGDRLPAERELIDIFGVSRPTLREALRSLATLGVLKMRHGGGAFVTDLRAKSLLAPLDFFVSLSADNAQEVFECRRLIEIEIARKCAEKAPPKAIDELEAMLAAQEKITDDPIAFRILDSEFHEKLFEIAGNSIMERLAQGFYNLGLDARRKATASPLVTRQSLMDHKDIVAGMKKGSVKQTAAAMDRHLKHIEATTLEAMQQAS